MPEPTPLSSEDVLKVARLARLAIAPEQVESYREKLSAVVEYVNRLQGLDLRDVEPLASPMEATSLLGEDVPGPTLSTEALMKMAPDSYPPFVRVPKVMDKSE